MGERFALAILVVGEMFLPTAAYPQFLHGGGVAKTCTSLKRCTGTCSSSGVPCATTATCPLRLPTPTGPGETCVLGNPCTGPGDCAVGAAAFCVGGPDAGLRTCTPPDTTLCRAAAECSSCIPVQEATAGDMMDCEVVVSNRDTFGDSIAIGSLMDAVFHPSPSSFDLLAAGAAPFGQCDPTTLPAGSPLARKRCFKDTDCAPGKCSLNLACVNQQTNVQGGPCTLAGSNSPCINVPGPGTGVCSVVLTPPTSAAEFFGVVHSDTVQAGDPTPVLDVATTGGVDLLTSFPADQRPPSPFELNQAGMITVVPISQVEGCRITGGGSVNGQIDPNIMAEISRAQFAGQVGAPCGCFGCFDKFDPKLASVQGEWNHQRKNKGGSLHANTFNSLVCSCLGGAVGSLCPDAAPPRTPADHICVTGIGDFTPDNGTAKKGGVPVAFRFEATDHGEPGRNDVYEMHILMPAAGQTTADLAKAICCTRPFVQPAGTTVIANDSGSLIAGNVQIHPALAKSTDGTCPPPSGMCVPIP